MSRNLTTKMGLLVIILLTLPIFGAFINKADQALHALISSIPAFIISYFMFGLILTFANYTVPFVCILNSSETKLSIKLENGNIIHLNKSFVDFKNQPLELDGLAHVSLAKELFAFHVYDEDTKMLIEIPQKLVPNH